MNMNMNLINHINNSVDDYVQLNSCGCWIVRLAKPALKTREFCLKLSSRQSEKAEWNKSMKTYNIWSAELDELKQALNI